MRDIQSLTDDEIVAEAGGTLFFDIECYPNYFIVLFKSLQSGKTFKFEKSTDIDISVPKLAYVLHNFTVVGFNSSSYDINLLPLVLRGFTNNALYTASVSLIAGMTRRDFQAQYSIDTAWIDHIDLYEVTPLDGSLKTYAARLHCDRIEDLPYPASNALTWEQAQHVCDYCYDDLDRTEIVWHEVAPGIELREKLTKEYGADLRSKSDAQVAEAVICSEVKKETGYWPKRNEIAPGFKWRYKVPDFVSFKTPSLQRMLETVANTDFALSDTNQIDLPESLSNMSIRIGAQGVYKLGIGGLHSTEKSVAHRYDPDVMYIDNDVASFYPAIILNLELFPKHIGRVFLKVYRSLVTRRLDAKRRKDKKTADALKISINGIFGKFANMYSRVFSPDLLIQVTLTGQLVLLMLIEMLELAGLTVVSANTDGVVTKCPRARYDDMRSVIKLWEQVTNFDTEETRYKAMYSRDVNNYIAVKEDDTTKVKGVYSELGSALNSRLSKNPEYLVCSEAVQAFLTKGKRIEDTIRNCNDFTKFVTVRKVVGGAHKDGAYLGKTIRWYYSTQDCGVIQYCLSGNKVPMTDGAKPCMTLPKEKPTDINYPQYLAIANEILMDVGYLKPRTLFD